jgi:hypothetical protein
MVEMDWKVVSMLKPVEGWIGVEYGGLGGEEKLVVDEIGGEEKLVVEEIGGEARSERKQADDGIEAGSRKLDEEEDKGGRGRCRPTIEGQIRLRNHGHTIGWGRSYGSDHTVARIPCS